MKISKPLIVLPFICLPFISSCNKEQAKEVEQTSALSIRTGWSSEDGTLYIETHESNNGGDGCLIADKTYNHFYWQATKIKGNIIDAKAFFYELDEVEAFVIMIPDYSPNSSDYSNSSFECKSLEFQQGKYPYRFSNVTLKKKYANTNLWGNIMEAQLGKHLIPSISYSKYDLDFYLSIDVLINKTEFVNTKDGDYYNAKISFGNERATFKISFDGNISTGTYYMIDNMAPFTFEADEIFGLKKGEIILFKLS